MLVTEKTNDRKQLLKTVLHVFKRTLPSLTNFPNLQKKKIMSYNSGIHLKLLFKNLKEKKRQISRPQKHQTFKDTISGKGLLVSIGLEVLCPTRLHLHL